MIYSREVIKGATNTGDDCLVSPPRLLFQSKVKTHCRDLWGNNYFPASGRHEETFQEQVVAAL